MYISAKVCFFFRVLKVISLICYFKTESIEREFGVTLKFRALVQDPHVQSVDMVYVERILAAKRTDCRNKVLDNARACRYGLSFSIILLLLLTCAFDSSSLLNAE